MLPSDLQSTLEKQVQRGLEKHVLPIHSEFRNFIQYLLVCDPGNRPTAEEALHHSFLRSRLPESDYEHIQFLYNGPTCNRERSHNYNNFNNNNQNRTYVHHPVSDKRTRLENNDNHYRSNNMTSNHYSKDCKELLTPHNNGNSQNSKVATPPYKPSHPY